MSGIRLWDNANIVESFPGITLPLTFSIARAAYADVYRGALRALGVREAEIAANADAFEHLLGHVRGRVYYDVGNWHRVLGLLPAFRANQALMERMMGAARPGGREGERAAPVAVRRLPAREALAILFRALFLLITFERRARRFTGQVEAMLAAEAATEVHDRPGAELVSRFDAVRRRALASWQPPIINDLFVMIFHGALRRATERWCGPGADGALSGLLRTGRHPGLVAAESLRAIAARVRADPVLAEAMRDPDSRRLVARLGHDPSLAPLRELVDAYVVGWGGRPPGALQLDRPTLADDPAMLLATIRDLVLEAPAGTEATRRRRGTATSFGARLRGTVRGGPITRRARWLVLALLIRRARYHLRWRERMRLLRMDLFAAGRRIFTELDRAWAAEGALERPGDVHYLEIEEVRAATAGTVALGTLRTTAAARRARFDAHRSEPAPPNRFESDGEASPADASPAKGGTAARGRQLRGIGVSPGLVRGRAAVVVDPRSAPPLAGRILVAPSTDPGWLPLMLAAAGLVVEQGSPLSHSAIVARELGLPAVVGLPGILACVVDDQLIEIDGGTGLVELRLDGHDGAGDG